MIPQNPNAAYPEKPIRHVRALQSPSIRSGAFSSVAEQAVFAHADEASARPIQVENRRKDQGNHPSEDGGEP
jgi:hypothetical protein